MQFNDTTNLSGAIQQCESWLFGSDYGAISGNTTLLKKFADLINHGLDQTTIEIIKSDGVWKYEDRNNTDLPIGRATLLNGIGNYELDSSHLKVIGVEVKDSNGNYYPITQVDYSDIRLSGQSDTEFFSTSGKPMYYDIDGQVLKLYPAPATSSVTLSEGLRVLHQREPNYFTSTDTTKELGVPKMFTSLPVLFACKKYAKQNGMAEKAREIDNEIIREITNIKDFFSKRNVDKRLSIKPAYRSAM